MFRTCDNKGFQVQFSNGYLISCQFGTMNYCSRRSGDVRRCFEERKMSVVDSEDCEIAIIHGDEFVTGDVLDAMEFDLCGDGMVYGHVSADDFGKIVSYVKDL